MIPSIDSLTEHQLQELERPPESKSRYVAWCDVMGASQLMNNAFRVARFRVFQFFALVMTLHDNQEGIDVVPAGDGVFIVSDDYSALTRFLEELMSRIQNVSLSKAGKGRMDLAFLIRASIAYGTVSTGSDFKHLIESTHGLTYKPDIFDKVVVGSPVSVSYHLEKSAPPLGIVLDVSVLQLHQKNPGPYLRWSDNPADTLAFVEKYFEFQLEHKYELGFDGSRAEHYIKLAREYFGTTLPTNNDSI
jgi:hypothetical protein